MDGLQFSTRSKFSGLSEFLFTFAFLMRPVKNVSCLRRVLNLKCFVQSLRAGDLNQPLEPRCRFLTAVFFTGTVGQP
ncbi:MAG: hypothetical protein C4519_14090 [Desulfobacteraceae bacterium]|nr:MAG: hypothetical protein C4519_14090 [Desulfobacteraceae bacterium]